MIDRKQSLSAGTAPALPRHAWGPLRRLAARLRKRGAGELASVTTEVLSDGNPQRYLDPSVIARFGLTPLIARRLVEGFISGLHKSPFHGFSVEFADHREYVAGDDLKFLDWFLYARTDHYYVKRYEEETNLRCYILLDRSASMAFGTQGMTKWDYSCFLATCLSYLMLKQQDAVGLMLIGDGQGAMVPPRSRPSHLNQLMRAMIHNPPAGGTDLAASLSLAVRHLKRRSIVVVISDLIDNVQQTLKAIRLLGSRRHDVIVFHVQDPAECEFPFEGSTLFRDVETGEELEVDPDVIRESYLEHVARNEAAYRGGLTEAGIDYQTINTRQPFDYAFSAYLEQRARLRR